MTQQEPIHAESAAALATKKNRVASVPSAKGGAATAEELTEQEGEGDPAVVVVAETDADTAEQNVGEVRKQVEKMSYEEGQSKSEGDINNDNNNNNNSDKGDESWEKIEKEEAESAKGDGLKRKALDRNDTSFNTVEQDVATKRQKDTPSVSHKSHFLGSRLKLTHRFTAYWRRTCTTGTTAQKTPSQLFRIRILCLSVRFPQNRLPCSSLARCRSCPGSS